MMTADESRSDPNRELTERTIRDIFDAEPARIDVERLSELLGQRTETIYKMLADRSIPAVKLPNKRWVIYSAAVRDWLIQQLDAEHTDEGEHL